MSTIPHQTIHPLQADFFDRMGGFQQFQQLFAHLPDVYFFFKDTNSRMMGASNAILKRLGVDKEEEVIGTTDFDHFPAQLAQEFIRDDQSVMRTGRPLINRVEIWYTEQRLLDWFVTTKLPVYGRDGSVIGVMGTVRDYSGAKEEIKAYSEVDDILNFIHNNLDRKIGVTELAQIAGISSRQLHRRFVQLFGLNVQEFLAKTRIKAASDALIHTDSSVGEIAARFGFCDQSAFTQQFKKHIGETPLRYRKRHHSLPRI
ncbi:AraC family transcriptional regulator [Roseiconus lacunae]|uniref:AraC family transcriptional regulator n=1 Tax=Roseiconus lacunae TaxID=2605694 RepID=A0ABT7PCD8_9BACT|nr:AraC family transcriptional regulator [Roseiconus lacunae]MCD0462404.1 AraC family transcriptional regulator [Roseiconus lacunae]MDM4014165.1 AraC family transcriptional regulator [Roseiconus lacunae]WRQ53461.1 AraC family transcriptional regulator [Stieleria sp. HD01]